MNNKKIASQLLTIATTLIAEVSEQEFQNFVVKVQQLASKQLVFSFDKFARILKYEVRSKGSQKVIANIMHYVGAAIKVEYDPKGLSNQEILNAGLKLELDNPTAKEAADYLNKLFGIFDAKSSKSKKDIQYMIKEFEKSIDRYEKNGEIHFKGNAEMIQMFHDDAASLRYGLKLIKEGEYKKAARYLDARDTVVREEVPEDLWDFIHQN